MDAGAGCRRLGARQRDLHATAAATPTPGASDVYVQRRGVCRDFTQLAVAFLRGSTSRLGTASDTFPTSTSRSPPSRWTSRRGWRRTWATAGTRSTRATTRVAPDASSSGAAATPLDVAMLTTYGQAPLTAMRVVAEPVDVGAVVERRSRRSAEPSEPRHEAAARRRIGDVEAGSPVDSAGVDWTQVRQHRVRHPAAHQLPVRRPGAPAAPATDGATTRAPR